MSKPQREAVGLRYDHEGSAAPRVIAKGKGELAVQLLEIAEAHGIPVRKDPDLCAYLSATQIGDEVPEEVYAAVASILAFLWRLNGEIE
ncbi:MAG: EscU/YscU/HrcU family type III secretion system export apparatus switch protein [Planctomycetota bacterium]|nr:EscU/YscU/HrcU family type III secretion system export apparatus switch protein [Planctomycetota bacterium]